MQAKLWQDYSNEKRVRAGVLEAENVQLKGQLDVAGITGVAYGACVAWDFDQTCSHGN